MPRPPCRPLTLLTFWAAGNVSLAPFSQVTCAETGPASQAFNLLGGDARRFQRRKYPLILVLEGNVLDDFLITFPWSSVWPWAPACLAGFLARSMVCPVCGRGGLGGRTGPCWASSPSLSRAGCGGLGSVAPARGMWEELFGSLFVFAIMGR